MRYSDLRSKYRLSNTAIDKLLFLKIITREESGNYTTPWGEKQLFRTSDVAGFLTQHTDRHWSIDNVKYQYKDLFFDIHEGKAEKAMYRITLHDFRSLAKSVSLEALVVWEKKFSFLLRE